MIGFVTHESALLHAMPAGHPERADRISAITSHLRAVGLTEVVSPHAPEPAWRETVRLVHDEGLVGLLERVDRAGGGPVDTDVYMSPHSLDAALRGTQGTLDATERVLRGDWSSAFVCMRPPGHHATPSRPMGFCLVNHVAVAAKWAVGSGAADRVAIFDWDAHHGNGTQEAFWSDGSVLYTSIHQYPWYPGTGDVTERGEGPGDGTTVNVPLPAGAGEEAYDRALDEVIAPAIHAFEPEIVFVSAGFDAHHRDPLCMMRLVAGSFYRLAKRVRSWGCAPVFVLEGGYDLDALAWSVGAMLSALADLDEPIGAPPDEREPISGHPDALRWVERAADRRRA